jgi:aminoglycoside/choline kinase family phosphotransferase
MAQQPVPEPIELHTRIDRYLTSSGLAARDPRLVPLTGDASDRRYFRVLLNDGTSLVLAVHAGPIDFATLPFANVAELFQHMQLPVPAILGHSDADGVVAQSDLGDLTLQAYLSDADTEEQDVRYREAIALIALMQRQGGEQASDRYLPYRLAFDVEKLTWELEFFVRHFLEAHRGAVLSAAERGAFAEEWSALAGELAGEPRVLCHRDYHSRNLMVHDNGLHIIDFQDARLGPDTYDLVSLLRDSYVDLTERSVEAWIAYFLTLKNGTTSPADEFRRRFDLMALQRNLKALGTFGYQATTRNNPGYVQYVPRTLRHVRANLVKYPRFARLHGLLSGPVSELR